jgi:hypothetical protein
MQRDSEQPLDRDHNWTLVAIMLAAISGGVMGLIAGALAGLLF